MDYYILINGKNYKIPSPVLIVNQDLFSNYNYMLDGKYYLDLDRLYNEKKLNELHKLDVNLDDTVGMLVMDTPLMNKKNGTGQSLKLMDFMFNNAMKKQDYEQAYNIIIKGLLMSLELYNDIIKIDDERAISL